MRQPVMDNGSTKTCELCHLLFLDYSEEPKSRWLHLRILSTATATYYTTFRLIKLCFAFAHLLDLLKAN